MSLRVRRHGQRVHLVRTGEQAGGVRGLLSPHRRDHAHEREAGQAQVREDLLAEHLARQEALPRLHVRDARAARAHSRRQGHRDHTARRMPRRLASPRALVSHPLRVQGRGQGARLRARRVHQAGERARQPQGLRARQRVPRPRHLRQRALHCCLSDSQQAAGARSTHRAARRRTGALRDRLRHAGHAALRARALANRTVGERHHFSWICGVDEFKWRAQAQLRVLRDEADVAAPRANHVPLGRRRVRVGQGRLVQAEDMPLFGRYATPAAVERDNEC